MARISIEDCLANIENRFALVMIAVDRTRALMEGEPPLIKSKNKEAVTALREIAEGKIIGTDEQPAQTPAPKSNSESLGFTGSSVSIPQGMMQTQAATNTMGESQESTSSQPNESMGNMTGNENHSDQAPAQQEGQSPASSSSTEENTETKPQIPSIENI